MDKEIFISHRSSDKKFALLLERFLTTCGIPSEAVFCSSLPGNDVIFEIPDEIKAALSTSKLYIALLSDAYYQSAYCQNEAGILWYSSTKKVVFALPEINEHNMEGFLNKDYKIRRMENKKDLFSFSDILKDIFPSFIKTVAGLDDKIDTFLDEYRIALGGREPANPSADSKSRNELDIEIQAGSFSNSEKVILLYFYETQKTSVEASLISFESWMTEQNAKDIDTETALSLLSEDGIIEPLYDLGDNLIEYKLTISNYRKLRKVSQHSYSILRSALRFNPETNNERSNNRIDNLIKKGFSTEEVLLLYYILDLSLQTLYAGWQTKREEVKIRDWEIVNELDNTLSSSYSNVLNRLIIRKLVEVNEITVNGKPKEYRLSSDFQQSLQSINSESKEKIQKVIESHRIAEELPF